MGNTENRRCVGKEVKTWFMRVNTAYWENRLMQISPF